MADSSKTEQATPRKRQQAREKGGGAQPRPDVESRCWTACRAFSGKLHRLCRQMAESVPAASEAGRGELGNRSPLLAGRPSRRFRSVAAGRTELGGRYAPAAWRKAALVFAPGGPEPKPARLSPASRLKQLFSLPSSGRLVKSLVPGGIHRLSGGQLCCAGAGPDLCTLTVWAAPCSRLPDFQRFARNCLEIVMVLLVWSGVDYLHRAAQA